MPSAHFLAVISATYRPDDDAPIAIGPRAWWRIRFGKSQPFNNETRLAELYFKFEGLDKVTGGTPIASTVSGSNSAANAFDRNTATRYQSVGNQNNWLGYHFPGSNEIDQIGVVGANTAPENNPRHYLIETSDDGVTWTLQQDYWDPSGALTSGEYREFTVSKINYHQNDDLPHRYWRLRPFAFNNNDPYCSIREVQFLNDAETDLTTGGTVLGTNSRPTFPPSNAFDKNGGSIWRTDWTLENMFIGYDFITPVTIQKVRINPDASGTPLGFAVEFSDDGSNWTPVTMFMDEGWTNNVPRTFYLPRATPLSAVTHLSKYEVFERIGPSVSRISRYTIFEAV